MAPTFVKTAFFLLVAGLVSAKGALHAPHGHSHLDRAALHPRALTPAGSATLPPKWTYYGCYYDAGNPRTLASATYTSTTGMTDESCVTFCKSAGYIFAGVEYAQECYCGNNFVANVSEPITDCSMACTGNANEPCGGPNRLSVFWSGAQPPAPPSTNPGPPGWKFQGCYTEGMDGRALTTGMAVPGGASTMTVAACTSACLGAGYSYAGVEYADECYCANAITFGAVLATNQGDCNMLCAGNSSEYCGAGNRLDVYELASAIKSTSAGPAATVSTSTATGSVSPTPTPTGPVHVPAVGAYKWAGCYTEANGIRALSSNQLVNYQTMTVEICASFCASYTMFGVEYSGECYCGNALNTGSVPAATTDCSMLCDGNQFEYCGAGNRLDVYTKNPTTSSSLTGTVSTSKATGSVSPTPTPTGPVHVPAVGAYKWAGCYTEANGIRALSSNQLVNYQTMTVEICASFCAAYTMFGVEYSGECYCGNALNTGSVPAATTDCSMLCDGNQFEYCGAGNRLDVYTKNPTTSSSLTGTVSTSKVTGSVSSTPTPTGPVHVPSVGRYNWIGCYTEANGIRALSSNQLVNYQTMTVEICAAFCSAYTYFGVEYGGECYCGSSPNAGSVPAATTDCSMLCDGNQYEYCGAGNRLDLYKANGTAPTVSTTAGPTSTVSIGGSSATSLPKGWVYGGCFVDNLYGRIMRNQEPDNQQNTIEQCVNTCAGLGYTVAGTEYGVQCFCDNAVVNGGALAATQADCNVACPGNTVEKCGAGNRMSVYYTGNLTVLPVPVEQTSGIQGWTYKGCRTDNVVQGQVQVRTLPWQLILTTTNSATNCLLQCSKFGYNAAGMEYGVECYCGDIADVATGLSTLVADSQCSTVCSGNATEICGAGNLLSYYEWTGTPLYNWHTPTGNAAGEYQLLIGGLCVPLTVTAGVNGKIQFLEKFGTSPNASSTGAYELDPSLINYFDEAWRTMHLKTDVFCSASLTLPDKVGRQINVGGWAEESLFGVRLYWPDGSPGVASVNDWQENESELALQTPRWYPSIMILTNGSIMVIGGEVGSNSAPSPTIEILPATGGGLVYCDWLERTDPLNLYPFLAILPSGGIFVAYYNEARILEQVNFNTIKTLPNIPGNVNNPGAGRTYPLEGTAVILPQVAPYGAPLTVLLCGGSTTGAGEASDNCVSTQPDAATPVWTIERMPSKRVMTCICALPDGTYLIVNGAKQGVAGFGLATDPNLVAVLYDPSQPVGSRMSIMASTIVARLYHSEAVLMQDGRVVVSGSDPQDGVHPEEYRVEVFVPPYLLNGAIAPTLTVGNKDWTYGQQITVTISIPSGNVNNVKFSLLGAVSSTHGNSMGQRTFFPAFTCSSATSCTITAPPNAYICPNGWFQLFLLDGPTPGYSTWVRIGGDPGKLGNWPALSDFNVPGV